MFGHENVGTPSHVANDQLFDLFAPSIVGELQEEPLAALGSDAEVFNDRVHDGAARNRDQRVVRRSNAGAAEPDVFDRPFGAAEPDAMSDPERFLKHDQHRAEQIRQTVARGKSHGEAADAKAGEHREGRKPQLGSGLHQQSDRYHDPDEPHAQPDDLAADEVRQDMDVRYRGQRSLF